MLEHEQKKHKVIILDSLEKSNLKFLMSSKIRINLQILKIKAYLENKWKFVSVWEHKHETMRQ